MGRVRRNQEGGREGKREGESTPIPIGRMQYESHKDSVKNKVADAVNSACKC